MSQSHITLMICYVCLYVWQSGLVSTGFKMSLLTWPSSGHVFPRVEFLSHCLCGECKEGAGKPDMSVSSYGGGQSILDIQSTNIKLKNMGDSPKEVDTL